MRATARRLKSAIATGLLILGALAAVAPVALVVGQVLAIGLQKIIQYGGLAFLYELPPTPLSPSGGIGPALLGTLVMTALGAAMGFAVGFPVGVYIGEFKHEFVAKLAQVSVGVVVEFPTITIGLLVYSLSQLTLPAINTLLRPLGYEVSEFSGYAGAVALAIIMIPYVALFTASAYSSIERTVREAAYSIAGSQFKAVMVAMRKAISRSILAATLLGTAKIAGETAPLLFTAFGNDYYTAQICLGPHCVSFVDPGKATGAIPLLIYYMAQTNYVVQNDVAWGAAAILVLIVLAIFTVSKLVLRRW